jgi:chorismate-pyruvate lyase
VIHNQNKSRHDYHILGDLVLEELSPLQRILLIADGTVTNLLEVSLDEGMEIVKLMEASYPLAARIELLALDAGHTVLARKILLKGKISRRNWLYADSLIVLERLEPAFQAQLLHSHTPIGKLWIAHQTETYKEIISATRECAGDLAEYFAMQAEDILLSRTYRVFCRKMPVMLITEKFPISYFNSADLTHSHRPQ